MKSGMIALAALAGSAAGQMDFTFSYADDELGTIQSGAFTAPSFTFDFIEVSVDFSDDPDSFSWASDLALSLDFGDIALTLSGTFGGLGDLAPTGNDFIWTFNGEGSNLTGSYSDAGIILNSPATFTGLSYQAQDTFPDTFSPDTWDVTISLSTFVPPPPPDPYAGGAAITPPVTVTDLGVIADEGEVFTVDTFGSTTDAGGGLDTELALYDADGTVILSNDDFGSLQSQITTEGEALDGTLFEGLSEGTYYLAVGEFNTIFEDGFVATGGDAAGTILGQANGVEFTGALGEGEVLFWSFQVVPTPGAVAVFAVGGLTAVRRRR